ncbi:MAG: hypothetical protein QM723_34925 [Myxococcaceae bacterium]
MRRVGGAFLLAVAAFWGGEAGASKISIGPFSGPSASSVRGQVVSALCDQAECVAETKVFKGNKPDWKKAKKEKVDYAITGTVKAKGKKKTVELQVLKSGGAVKLKKVLPIEGGAIQDSALSSATEELLNAVGASKPPEEKKPPAEETKPPPEEKKPPPEEKKPPPEEKKPPPEEKKPPPEEEEPPAPKHTSLIKPQLFVAQLTLDIVSRSFSYSNVTSMNLRSYSAGFILAPDPHIEVYPLGFITEGIASGLGIEAGYQTAVGLKSKRSGSDVSYPTSMNRLDAGLRFRYRPLSDADAGVTLLVGYRSQSFSVGKGSDGTSIDGLPSVNYSAVRLGLAGDVPFGDTGLLAFADFTVLPVLSSGPIISPAYFTKGGNLGIDAQIGLGFKLPPLPSLQIRAAFDFARYGLSFKPAATDTYRADGAADLYIGGEIGLRFTYQ